MKSILRTLSLSLFAIIHTVLASQIAMPETPSLTLYPDLYASSGRECQHTTVRTIFGTVDCHVRGYPSLGGIVLGTFTAAELSWLGISRSQPSYRSQDPQTEDEFVSKMLRLGAHWWKSESFYNKRSSQVRGGYPWPDNYPPKLNVGYPSTGGVRVLRVKNEEFGQHDWARARMAFTMDERCAVLKERGATFYKLVEDCPDIAKSLEDGVAIGRMWEERMKEIGDW